jgi:hypothetical protein
VSGFLRRLRFGTFGCFQFIVVKIELVQGDNPSDPKNSRYLVRRKDWLPQKNYLNEIIE